MDNPRAVNAWGRSNYREMMRFDFRNSRGSLDGVANGTAFRPGRLLAHMPGDPPPRQLHSFNKLCMSKWIVPWRVARILSARCGPKRLEALNSFISTVRHLYRSTWSATKSRQAANEERSILNRGAVALKSESISSQLRNLWYPSGRC